MKILSFIFSLYILLLPCLPCTDTEECNDNRALITSRSNHSNHQHEQEACNPFCSCACCGQNIAPTFQLQKIAYSKPLLQVKQQFCYNNILLPSTFHGNIWQPPRFS